MSSLSPLSDGGEKEVLEDLQTLMRDAVVRLTNLYNGLARSAYGQDENV